MKRIKKSGNGARAISIPVCTFFLGCIVANYLTGTAVPAGLPGVVGLCAVVTLLVYITFRSMVMGVFLAEDKIRVRSWFRTWIWEREDLVGCRVAAYDGLLNEGDLDGSGRFLKVLEFTVRTRHGIRSLRPLGTLSGKKNGQLQASRVLKYVGEGTSPTRARGRG